jgi:plasmid stabilization system protein ParE
MVYKIISTSSTEQDISQAVEWYISINKPLAREFLKELRLCKTYLQKHPKKIEIKYQNVRIAYLKTFPYGIHFQLKENEILILAVFHTSENPNKWDKR